MANRYNVEAIKGRTNYFDNRTSGPVVIDAILDRGAITVAAKNTVGYKGKVLGMPSMTFATNFDIDVVNRGEAFVQLVPTAAELTYEACQGRPVVQTIVAAGGVFGTLLTYGAPLMADPPDTAAANSLAKRITGKYQAIEAVKLYGMEYRPVPVKVSDEANITVGSMLTYDVSSERWVLDAADGTAVMACHAATADDLYVGALFGPTVAVSQA